MFVYKEVTSKVTRYYTPDPSEEVLSLAIKSLYRKVENM
jgi:hypothetical protein